MKKFQNDIFSEITYKIFSYIYLNTAMYFVNVNRATKWYRINQLHMIYMFEKLEIFWGTECYITFTI